MSQKIIMISPKEVRRLEVTGLAIVGGRQSRGVVLEGLRSPQDYAAISAQGSFLQVHSLIGPSKANVRLHAGEPLMIEDLVLVLDDATLGRDSSDDAKQNLFWQEFAAQTQRLAVTENLNEALTSYVSVSLNISQMQSGLLITRDGDTGYQVRLAVGLHSDSDWLSESLVTECLSTQKTVFVQNVMGSPFEKNRSVVSHQYLSFLVQPLVVRGEVLGVLMLCSQFPHPGLRSSEMNQLSSLTQMCALAYFFQSREARMQNELLELRGKHQPSGQGPFVTSCPILTEQIRIAEQIAATDLSVVILGETGVGKEKLARWIHDHSDRRSGPFVAINCGAIPSELLESLLFGHKKGSFTGAYRDQAGKFELAKGGTLFLDEIGDLPLLLQVKLLRVLQERQIEPVGGRTPIDVDVRILAATHKDLQGLRQQGVFREDLFYRLAEVILRIPGLRERPQDIATLADELLKQTAKQKTWGEGTLSWLAMQSWPGNVRELQSAIRRATILSRDSAIQIQDFALGALGMAKEAHVVSTLRIDDGKEQIIVDRLKKALVETGGHRRKTAEKLGVTVRTLFRYLDQYGDKLEGFQEEPKV